MVAYTDFVAAFPEFSNAVLYPQAGVTFWLSQASIQLNARRFGPSLDLATMLFVAHNMVLGAQAAATAAMATGVVGEASGPVAAKTVGPVSVNYDTSAVAVAGAGFWNQTQYGQRLFQLMQTYCSGPVYIQGQRGVGRNIGFGLRRF